MGRRCIFLRPDRAFLQDLRISQPGEYAAAERDLQAAAAQYARQQRADLADVGGGLPGTQRGQPAAGPPTHYRSRSRSHSRGRVRSHLSGLDRRFSSPAGTCPRAQPQPQPRAGEGPPLGQQPS